MITVFGSINVDLVTRVEHAPKPGETVHGSDYRLIPGGKGANQALAARRASADVRLLGAVGDDTMADVALSELRAAGVDLAGVAVRPGATGLAVITVEEGGENSIVVTPGANARLSAKGHTDFSAAGGGILLLQLEVPFDEVARIARGMKRAFGRSILSIAPFRALPPADLEPFSIVLVNEHEAADLASSYGLATRSPAEIVSRLADRLGRTVIATLGPQGAVAAGLQGDFAVPAIPVDVVDTTGAGDAFAGTFAAFLDEGLPFGEALRLAAIAGSLACTREGAQPSFPTRAEIDAAAG